MGKDFAREFWKICKAEGLQTYSIMIETKANFAEPTIRSLKSIIYRYREVYGYTYIHKFSQFVTIPNSGKNAQKIWYQKTFKNSDFFSVLYSKPLREYRKPNFKIGEFASPGMIYPSGRVISNSLITKIRNCCPFCQKPSNIHNKAGTRRVYQW